LPWLINSGHIQRLLKLKWVSVLVFDELTKMKNASKKAQRRKLLLPWLPRFERRWGLTGSPASNGLINLFGQINVLDLGAAFGPYITHYRNQFFNPVGMWGWVLKEGADELIYARIKPVALRMTLGSGVVLPELRTDDIIVELPAAARKAYDEMEDELVTILGDDRVTAGSASAVYGKCCQLASGAVFKSAVDPVTGEALGKPGGAREWHAVHDEKLDALEELIEELQGQQVLIAYWYRHSLERLQERLGKKTPYIGSGVSIKEARSIEEKWNAGKISILLGHPASIAHGLNLQGSNAHHVVWYDLTPDHELYDQLNRRLRRRGNKAKAVYVHHIVARQTVDAWGILPSLRRKEKGQARLFDALRQIVKSKGVNKIK
jgi:SNF2 family DNA or RNA helicase